MTEPTPNNHKTIPDSQDQPVCSGCPDADKCRSVWSMPNQGPFTSAGLLLSSILAFLFPLFTAIIAAAAAGAFKPPASRSPAWEIAAAAIGLIAGCALARLLMPLIKKRFSHPENAAK